MKDEFNIKKLSAEGIEDYLYCGLLYKMKHHYELPYMPGSVKEAFYYAYKKALLKFLHEIGLASKPLGKCVSEAQAIFVRQMRFILGSFENMDISNEDLVAKGVLQLNESHKLIRPHIDVVAAIDLPVTINYANYKIDYNIDALVVNNDTNSSRTIRVMSIVDDLSDMALSSKHDHLEFGLMKQSIREHFMTGKKSNGNFQRAQIELIKVSGTSPEINKTGYGQSVDSHLNPLLDTALHGISQGVFLPTGQAQKCNSCWFNSVCNKSLSGPDFSKDKVTYLENKLKTKQKLAITRATNIIKNSIK